MKKILILMSLICLAICFCCSCAGSASAETSPEHTEPTGYPDGELQQQFVFYNGNVYVYAASYLESLPENYVNVGEIKSIDNVNMPSSDFQAAHLKIGEEVYSSNSSESSADNYILVKRTENRFEQFIIYTEVQ